MFCEKTSNNIELHQISHHAHRTQSTLRGESSSILQDFSRKMEEDCAHRSNSIELTAHSSRLIK